MYKVLYKDIMDTIARNFFLYHYVKEIENFESQQNLLRDMHQNLIRLVYIKMQLIIKLHAILSISFTLVFIQNLCHTQTDIL